MKKIISAVVVIAAMTSPTFAEKGHNHGDGKKGGMMMGMMSHDQMTVMHKHMQEMQSVMEKIKQETDPKKRHELMQQHMASMQKGMHMMNGDQGMMKEKKGMNMKSMDMEKRMGMMGQHMNMMQMMMGQMMEHSAEDKKGKQHLHGK